MQPTSEQCSHLEELSCKEDSVKENPFCFNQNQDKGIHEFTPKEKDQKSKLSSTLGRVMKKITAMSASTF